MFTLHPEVLARAVAAQTDLRRIRRSFDQAERDRQDQARLEDGALRQTMPSGGAA